MKTPEEKKVLCHLRLIDFLRINAKSTPRGVFLYDEAHIVTWQCGLELVYSAADILLRAGVKKGDLVCIRAMRGIETAILFSALNLLGAVAVPTDARFAAEEVIARSGVEMTPAFTLQPEGVLWRLTDAKQAEKAVFSPLEKGHYDMEALSGAEREIVPTDPSLIIFTSGSTGKSKAVLLCQQNYIANSVDGSDLFGEGPNDRGMLVLPLHHIFGLAQIVCAIVSCHSLYFPEKTEPGYVLPKIKQYGITVIYGVPTWLLMLKEAAEKVDGMTDTLRFCLIAGGPSTGAQMLDMEQAFRCHMVPVYGMSEFVGITTMPFDASMEDRCSGVGRFYPLNEGHIITEDGREAAVGECGEICVRGMDLMLGYYHSAEETAITVKDGLLHTGDIGYRDEKGIIHLTGRKREIIVCGGENLSAAKIERALLSVRGVREAAVVPVRDAHYGEVPVAMITTGIDFTGTEAALQEQLTKLLTRLEQPRLIRITQAMPLTSSGKIDKQAIRRMMEHA